MIFFLKKKDFFSCDGDRRQRKLLVCIGKVHEYCQKRETGEQRGKVKIIKLVGDFKLAKVKTRLPYLQAFCMCACVK